MGRAVFQASSFAIKAYQLHSFQKIVRVSYSAAIHETLAVVI